MIDFDYYAPTQVVFGKDSESQIGSLVKHYGGSKVLLHYGGQSAQRSGLLDVVKASLAEMADKCCEFGARTVGALMPLHREDMVAIYRMAN